MVERRIDVAWSVAGAKAQFAELLDQVEREGPQVISRRGKDVAVVVSVDEWRRKTERKGTLAEFFANSPLRGSDVVIERDNVDHREIEL